MLKKIYLKLIIALMTTLLVIACQNTSNNDVSNNSQNCQVITHDFGETEICQKVEKIAVLGGYNLAQILSLDRQPYALGNVLAVEQGKYINNIQDFFPILGNLMTVKPLNIGSAINPSLEVLSQIKPDLILGETRNESQYQILSQIAPTLLFKDRGFKGKWQQDLMTLAQTLNETEKAEKVIEKYEANLAKTKADFSSITARNNQVLLLVSDRLNNGLFGLGEKSDLADMLIKLGFQIIPVTKSDSVEDDVPISLEALPELGKKADYIFILGYNRDVQNKEPQELLSSQTSGIKKDWQENPFTKSLEATQNNQVYFPSYVLWRGINSAIASNHILDELRKYLLN